LNFKPETMLKNDQD